MPISKDSLKNLFCRFFKVQLLCSWNTLKQERWSISPTFVHFWSPLFCLINIDKNAWFLYKLIYIVSVPKPIFYYKQLPHYSKFFLAIFKSTNKYQVQKKRGPPFISLTSIFDYFSHVINRTFPFYYKEPFGWFHGWQKS